MYADTPEELHAAAAKLGLLRRWCSDHVHKDSHGLLHYDLTPNKREQAVKQGVAEEKDQEHMSRHHLRAVNDFLTTRAAALVKENAELKEEIEDLKAMVANLKKKLGKKSPVRK